MVVEFKRGVYEMALTELSRYLPRHDVRNRFLRSGSRARDQEYGGHADAPPGASFELPPGGSFEPDPQTNSETDVSGEPHAR